MTSNRAFLLLLGLFTGFASSALGIGGGVILVPALVLLFSFRIKKAVGTSLATIVPVALIGILSHFLIDRSHILFKTAGIILIGSLLGARFGADIVERITSRLLRRLFALLLVLVGLKMTGLLSLPTETLSSTSFLPYLVLLGLLAGSSASLFGIGGGVIMVPALNLFFGLSMLESVATSLTVILPTTLAGAIFHSKFDNIDQRAALYLVPTALIGSVSGAFFANSVPEHTLTLLFGILLLFASIRIFQQKEVKQ